MARRTQETGDLMPRELPAVLADLRSRTMKGGRNFYRPLTDQVERAEVRKHYWSRLPGWLRDTVQSGSKAGILTNNQGTPITRGWTRVVVGDFGAYVEFSEAQARVEYLRPKWPGPPSRPVKYIWLETKDSEKTKVYQQVGRVTYADYRPGMYYVSPDDVQLLGGAEQA